MADLEKIATALNLTLRELMTEPSQPEMEKTKELVSDIVQLAQAIVDATPQQLEQVLEVLGLKQTGAPQIRPIDDRPKPVERLAASALPPSEKKGKGKKKNQTEKNFDQK